MSKSSKKLTKEFLKHKGLLFTALAAMFLSGITSVLPSWFVKISIDGLAAIQNNVEKFSLIPQQLQIWLANNIQDLDLENFLVLDVNNFKNILPLAIIGVFLIEAVFKFAYQYCSRKLGLCVVKDIRERFHRHLNKMSMKDISNIDSGSLVSVVSSDLQSLQSWLAESMMNLFSESFKALFLFSWLLLINWKLTIISTIVIPFFAIPVIKLGKGIRNNAKAGQDQVGSISTYFAESINNQSIIKAFNLEESRDKGFKKVSTRLYETFKKWALYMALVSPLTNFVGAIGISAILYYGLNAVLNQTLTVGEFSSFFVTSLLLYDPVKRLGRVSTIFQSALGVADRFYTLIDIPCQLDTKEAKTTLINAKGHLEIKDLSFSYTPEDKLFDKINLSFKAKTSTALVGPSGSGKTTLISLLLRFFEIDSGSIFIDDVNISTISLKNLRDQFALVSQEALLFSGTLKENVIYGLGSKHKLSKSELEDRFQASCKKAHVTEFMDRLSQKENSNIGEAGNNLSIGQKQRISIARAFMSYAPIVILDEPTSALDNESQELIYSSIQNLMKEKTVIVIAHRLSTIKSCDQIVYIENGKIIEQGSHTELMNQGQAYASLIK
jgi:ATP-binding cassette, subfamily B, bacterial MsbA